MSGKSYTMKEMKAIVEYLTEHRAYGDIKGRKMWMNLASSKVTNRTWQSLKETFLKRILPDIHNPYYKLTLTQISSFQQGHDIEVRLNNKLQIRSSSQNSDTDGDIEKDADIPGTSNGKNEVKTAGEDHKLSNARASTETLVLENCYENAEEIRKDLQSPVDEVEGTNEMQPTKSMRELITYSEPLTPMIQSVIDDFVTDDEEREPQMQIVESENTTDKNEDNSTVEISDSEGNYIRQTNQILVKTSDPDHAQAHNANEQAKDSSDTKESEVVIEKSSALMTELNDTTIENDSSKVEISLRDNIKSLSGVTQNNSVNIADTLLPGNQEAFDENLKKIPDKHNLSLNKKENLQNGRKRASSQDPEPKSVKRKLSKMKSISDTEKSNSTKGFIFKKSEFSTLKQAPPDVTNVTSLNMFNEKSENTPTQEEQAVDNSQNNITKNSAEIENPCLKNVSLYDEQFSTEKYTDSDTSNMEHDKNKKGRRTQMRDNKVENLEDEKNISEDKHKQSDRKGEKMSDKNKKVDDTKKFNDDNVNKNAKNMKSIYKNYEVGDKNGQEDAKAKSTTCQTNKHHISNKAIQTRSKSRSSSEYVDDPVVLGKKRHIKLQKRERALDHMLGFASGGKKPVKGAGYRNRTTSQSHTFNYGNMSTESSEWTSDTGSEMIVPQRHCSMKRRTRKYLKPRSARILSLEEEGGLFVMYGRKVYPVVQKGKLVKNYVTYTQEDDVEETFWKMKYVEEKKKTDELTKMLNDAKVDKPSSKVGESSSKQEDSSRVSPVQPTTTPTSKSSAHSRQEDTHNQVETKTDSVTIPAVQVQAANPNPEQQRKTVRIKFIKKNQEVELEGHWSQLNPVLDHVAQLFQKESETISISSSSSKKEESPAGEPLVESGKSTPTDEIVQKVNQREIEIAQEIEKYYKQENIAAENPAELELNVTKRKGRQIKSPSASSSIAKRAKLDVEAKANETAEKASAAEDITTKTRRTRASTNSLSETNQTSSSEANQTYIRTRRSTSRISQDKTATKQDEEVRYKFPSPALSTRKSYANKAQSKVAKNTQQRKSKSATNLVSSSGNVLQTIETTQEYPVSEFCPSPICINGGSKTCLSFSTHTKRHSTTRLQQRTNHNITDDITTESSNSFQTARIESMTFQNSTITSEIYKSESYRLLMNNDPSHTKNTTKLQRIEETSLASKDFDQNKEAFEAIAASDNIDLDNKENALELTQVNTDNENSSNVSLPTSPVLSIVENISISKTMLSSMDLDDFPFDDKAEAIDSPDQIMLNGLMTPDVDVTMPLMEQECGIEKSSHDGKAYHYNLNVSKTIPAVSESLLNQITTVNIGDPSLSESLNVKLKDLLLESTKKRFKNKDTVKKKTEDLDVKDKTEPKKDNSRKRSSTPRKRQRIREPTIPDTEPCLVEEHIESCRHGRQSCPPVILISDHEAGAIITPTETAQFITTRRRNKKDIIKVKILKPKAKTQDTSSKQSDMVDFTDSGINHTESDIKLHGLNDSVDLIHNHSDTCLNAHECMGDSVKIIDNSASSIISLDTNSAHSDIIVRHSTVGNLTQELFSSDAQDGSDVIKEFDFAEPRQVNSESTTVYHTPLGTQSSPTSIITDDLSDEVPEEPVQNKRWYLFSEDESSNTNCFNKNSKTFGCGANLEQIFPVTCAIPDLSTITEISRENGDSKKFCDDTNTRDRLNSPSIFI